MRFYKSETVFDAAQERIAWLYDEFDDVVVSFSGGKDSCICYNLAMMEAEKRGKLPLKVLFIDQEAEWQAAVDYVRTIMTDPRVEPMHFQMPIKIFNATSFEQDWLHCWELGVEWMREKEPYAIIENVYGTDRFKDLFGAIVKHHFAGQNICLIGGVRTEESPNRLAGLTGRATYKHVTWGKTSHKDKNGRIFTFYPIYDWSYTDVWKAIHDHGWPYCKIYDYMYQQGVGTREMRVSNLHHETAVQNLYLLQEFEPQTWEAINRRMDGVHGVRNMKRSEMFKPPVNLPFMFHSWKDYRDFLLEHLVIGEHKAKFIKKFAHNDERYLGMTENGMVSLRRVEITTILANDYHFTKLDNFNAKPEAREYRNWKSGNLKQAVPNPKFSKWIPTEAHKGPSGQQA